MLRLGKPSELTKQVGKTLGPSDWVLVTQAMIDRFADVTGDHQWIHIDTERAAREVPGGKTIAHGYFVLSLVARLLPTIYVVEGASRGLNYGINKLRFLNPVPSETRLRASITFKALEQITNGQRCIVDTTVEVEGQEKPALVAELIFVYYD